MLSRTQRITLEINIVVSIADPQLEWPEVVNELDYEIVGGSEDVEVLDTEIADSWLTD